MFFHSAVRKWKLCFLLVGVIAAVWVVVHHSPDISLARYCIPKKRGTTERLGIRRDAIIPPFRKFESRFRRAPALKTQVCVIEKNMSTILTALVCYFYDPEKFRAANRSVNREVFNKRFCARKNEAFSFMGRVYHGLNKTAEWFHLAVSREPIERFISGFADKCLIEKIFTKRRGTCNGCRGNVTCFLEKEFDRMQRFSRGETRLNSFDDRHFYPQNWRCQFANYFAHFKIIRYANNSTEAFYRDFFDAIRTRNATESDVRFVEEQVKNGRTRHTTSNSDERARLEKEVRSSPYLMRLLVQAYYYDFIIFNYPFPKIRENGK